MRNFILLLLPLLLLGCRKEKEPVNFFGASFGDCFEDFRMPFVEDLSLQSGNVVSSETSEFGPLRMIAGRDNRMLDVGIAQTAFTTTPQLVLNGNYLGYKLILGIKDKRYSNNSTDLKGAVSFFIEKSTLRKFDKLEEMIDSTILIGKLPLGKIQLQDSISFQQLQESYSLSMWLGSCDAPSSATCSSNTPEQNGTLECTKFLKTYLDDSIRYQINFRFDDITMKAVQSFKLHNGNMSLDFKIPR